MRPGSLLGTREEVIAFLSEHDALPADSDNMDAADLRRAWGKTQRHQARLEKSHADLMVELELNDDEWERQNRNSNGDDGAVGAEGIFGGLKWEMGTLIEEGIPIPKMVIDGLIYEGASHWFSGHKKNGKTLIAMYVSHLTMLTGRKVIYLDYENGPRRIARRFEAMDANTTLLNELFGYDYRAPIMPQDPRLPDALAHLVEDHTTDAGTPLVVIDSQAKSLSVAGLSEDKADDVTKWTTRVVLELCNVHGATTIVIDHEKKGATARSGYSRGSGAKGADADVSWFVSMEEGEDGEPKLNYETPAIVTLTLRHDRDGLIQGKRAFKIGDGEGGLPIEPCDAPSGAEAKAAMSQDIVKLLAEAPDRALSRSDLASALGVNPSDGTFSRTLGSMEAQGMFEERKKRGSYTLRAEYTEREVPL